MAERENTKQQKQIKAFYKKSRVGTTQKKILLLLLGGVALGLSRSPKQYFKILKGMQAEWKNINKQSLRCSIRSLYEAKLIEGKKTKTEPYCLFSVKTEKRER